MYQNQHRTASGLVLWGVDFGAKFITIHHFRGDREHGYDEREGMGWFDHSCITEDPNKEMVMSKHCHLKPGKWERMLRRLGVEA